jgi:hypothetical protein
MLGGKLYHEYMMTTENNMKRGDLVVVIEDSNLKGCTGRLGMKTVETSSYTGAKCNVWSVWMESGRYKGMRVSLNEDCFEVAA